MHFLTKSLMFKAACLCTSLQYSMVAAADEPFFSKLTVQGSASLYKPADQLTMSISVVTQDQKAQMALNDNNEKMQKIIASLQLIGLEKGEFQTGQFSVSPTYSQPPKTPPSDWRPEINGYEVTNSVNIRTNKLDLAPKVIDATSAAGANQISSVSFNLQDLQKYRSEAISGAASNALADAKALADASNLKLVRILDISLGETRPLHRAYEKRAIAFAADTSSIAPIEVGDVEINANVSVVYEIAPL